MTACCLSLGADVQGWEMPWSGGVRMCAVTVPAGAVCPQPAPRPEALLSDAWFETRESDGDGHGKSHHRRATHFSVYTHLNR